VPAVKNPKRSTRRQPKPAALPRALDDGRESLDLYLDEISRIPLLTVDQEKALARKAFRGEIAAQERLARHNVRFVVSVAKQYQNRGVPLMDLIGEGNVGLMTAARKFDPDLRQSTFDLYTRLVATSRGRLVVLPESAFPRPVMDLTDPAGRYSYDCGF